MAADIAGVAVRVVACGDGIMNRYSLILVFLAILMPALLFSAGSGCSSTLESTDSDRAGRALAGDRDARMAWWREARFGLFIHWGLYAVPAGEWKGSTNHAEWIMHTARIPVPEYEKFLEDPLI